MGKLKCIECNDIALFQERVYLKVHQLELVKHLFSKKTYIDILSTCCFENLECKYLSIFMDSFYIKKQNKIGIYICTKRGPFRFLANKPICQRCLIKYKNLAIYMATQN